MNLTRRLFRKWRLAGSVKCIHLYSDASPVTGSEIQGMVVDVIFTDASMERFVCPGVNLAYGHTDTFSKGVSLLWAIWLIAGPSVDDLRWFCGEVVSLTTDFGVEMHLLEVPDFTEAFIVWIGGAPRHMMHPLVRHDVRLFARAVRIAGWSHTMGNLMKALAEEFHMWPVYIKHLRVLCKFFKNDSYRTHIENKLKDFPNINALVKSFTAGFAKWRYETVVEVLGQLGKLRQFCEEQLSASLKILFSHVQDAAELEGVHEACKDKPFWRWVVVARTEIFERLEVLRKWGMVCDHPEHEQLRRESGYKKKIDCPRMRSSSECQQILNPESPITSF